MKILSVSIAAYNAAKFLDKCIHSFVDSSVADKVELIIVNDGSKDNTKDVALKYADEYPDIVKFIDKENGGHGSTINASIPVATGKYYKVVDSDDWVDREGIEKLVAYLETCDVDLVLNPYCKVDERTGKVISIQKVSKTSIPTNQEVTLWDLRNTDIMMHTVVYKTEVLRKVEEKIDEHCFYVDVEYVAFPLINVNSVVVLDYPVYMYLVGQAEQSMSVDNLIKRREQHERVTIRLIEYYQKYRLQASESATTIWRTMMKANVAFQYTVYAHMKNNDSKKETLRFDERIKAIDKDAYRGSNGKYMKMIRFHRATHFVFYKLVLNILKTINRLPPVI